MILVKETAGDTLTGAIDGSNKTFETSFDFNAVGVKVYLNGMLMQADLDTGYDLIPPRYVIMKEPPLADPDGCDTLEVEYRADVKTGGGALGGCPDAPTIETMEPTLDAMQDIPELQAANLEPTIDGSEDKPAMIGVGGVRPSMVGTKKECS